MNSKLTKAVIAAGLLCTWDQLPAQADTYSFEGSITPSQTLSQVYFVFATGFCNSVVYTHKIADSVPGGVTTTFSFDMEMDAGARANSAVEPYGEMDTIFALYDNANNGVTVGYNTTAASKILSTDPAPAWLGTDLPAYFSDSDSVGTKDIFVSESDIADMLRTDTVSINGFGMFYGYPVLYPPRFANRPYDSAFSLVNYSSAASGGSAVVEEVPEPMSISLVLLGLAGLGLARVRRRRA